MCLEWLVILGHWGPGTRSDTRSSCHSSREGSSLASPAHDSAVHCSGRGPLTGSAYQRTAHVAGNSPPAFATRFPQSVLGNQRVKYPNYAPLTVWHRFVDPRSFPWRHDRHDHDYTRGQNGGGHGHRQRLGASHQGNQEGGSEPPRAATIRRQRVPPSAGLHQSDAEQFEGDAA